MPTLRELAARLVVHVVHEDDRALHPVTALADAQGVLFLCPACFAAHGGPVGTHSILVWFAGRSVPDDATPAPRWAASGTSIDDLTLSPSVQIECASAWHGFVTNGAAQ